MSIAIADLLTITPSFAYLLAREVSIDSLSKKDIIKCLTALGVDRAKISRLKSKQQLWFELQIASLPQIKPTIYSDSPSNLKFNLNTLRDNQNIKEFIVSPPTTITPNANKREATTNTVINYINSINANNFITAVHLFSANAALQPTFSPAILPRPSIFSYLKEKYASFKLIPEWGTINSTEDGYNTIKIMGKSQRFELNSTISSNLVWQFLLDPQNSIISKWEIC